MKLSKQTQNILKNFASINPSILLTPGNQLSTMSNDKNIIAYSDVDDTFPVEAGIYDVNEFLSVVDLFNDAELEFTENRVSVSDSNSSSVYGYADKEIITYPKNKLKFPGVDVSFQLTKDQLDKLMKASNTLGLPVFSISKENNDIIVKVVDPKNPSSNTYSCVVGTDDSDKKYEFLIKQEFFKFIKDDYTVSLSSKFIARFESSDAIEYYVAMEKSSTYSE